MGYYVDVAADGSEAVAATLRSSYDLILMDCQMPVLNGFDATRQIRRNLLHIPIIALTASATRDDQDECRRSGMDAFLTKPINQKDLADAIQRLLISVPAP